MIIFAVVIKTGKNRLSTTGGKQMKMKRWFDTQKEVEANNSHSEGNLLLR
jgi:hypothetical protein